MQFLQRNSRACSLAAMLCAAVGLAAPASAGGGNPVAVLDVNGTAAINAEISTFIASTNVTDNSASILGTISLASSDFSTIPGDLELIDLDLMLDPAAMPMGSVDGGKFLGSADPVGLMLTAVSMAEGKPMKDPVESGGIATFPVQLALTGEAFATYDLIGVDPVEDALIDLATIEPVNGLLEIFTLNSSLGELTVEATLFFETVRIPFEPGIVEIYITDASTMTLTATGEDPTAEPPNFCSIADLAEPCGTIDLADIGVFVDGFTMNQPIADLNRDGIFDLEDITAFVTAFQNNDCPGTDTYYCYYGGTGMAAIEFHNGNSAYAFGDHTTLTAGIALSGAALMLGFGSFRRKQA
jgi:hypothetical protein